jgi:hypothetical protein
MSFIDDYRQEISPEFALQLMPELNEDYLQDRPCKWEEDTIQLWKVASALIEDCDPSIEKHSFLCTPVFFDKTGKHRYFTSHEKTMQEQIAEFDQQLGVIHELGCTITDKDDNTEAKVWLLQIETEINHG